MTTSYSDILKRLLPRGAYNTEAGSAVAGDVGVEGSALDTAEGDIEQLLAEIFADTADELLSCFERVYGVPPTQDRTEDLPLRRAKIISKMRTQPGLSRAYMADALMPFFGYPPTITEYVLQQGDPPEDIYQWFAVQDPVLPILNMSVAAIQAAIDLVKPAHTQGAMQIAHPFLCDWEHSLTDNLANLAPDDWSILRI